MAVHQEGTVVWVTLIWYREFLKRYFDFKDMFSSAFIEKWIVVVVYDF
jgi:hypothetical protein